MIDIQLNGVAYGTGHGKTPDGQDVLLIRFLDQQSGLVFSVNLIGDQIEEFIGLCRPSGIEVAKTMPKMHAGGGILG